MGFQPPVRLRWVLLMPNDNNSAPTPKNCACRFPSQFLPPTQSVPQTRPTGPIPYANPCACGDLIERRIRQIITTLDSIGCSRNSIRHSQLRSRPRHSPDCSPWRLCAFLRVPRHARTSKICRNRGYGGPIVVYARGLGPVVGQRAAPLRSHEVTTVRDRPE
jgi:hypothetical protein